MINQKPILTDSGIPILLLPTYRKYQRELEEIGKQDPKRVEEWVEGHLRTVKSKDPCYERFIRETAGFYPEQDQHNKVVLERLTAGYVLLDREGPVPVLNPEKFQEAFRVLSPRTLALLNIGSHLDMIRDKNPVFFRFIIDSAGYMPGDSTDNPLKPSLRTSLMSDLSNGYTMLYFCKS